MRLRERIELRSARPMSRRTVLVRRPQIRMSVLGWILSDDPLTHQQSRRPAACKTSYPSRLPGLARKIDLGEDGLEEAEVECGSLIEREVVV
jgi:hypothetical protein